MVETFVLADGAATPARSSRDLATASAALPTGASCVTVPLRRERPQAKDTRFLSPAQGAYRDLPAGVHEGLLVGEDGALLEGLSSNVFAVMDGVLRTEDARALHGTTRGFVLELARGLVPVSLEAVKKSELP